MKQTVEEAANDYLNRILESTDFEINLEENNYDSGARDAILDVTERAFVSGAEWQAKQMAWINVNNKMPEDGFEVDERTILAHTKNVIVLYKNGYVGKGKRIYIDNKKGWQWSCLKGKDIIYWMYYPN